MDPATVPLTFFRKASGSINGPTDDIVKPGHVRFLDYEVEIGLVIGRDLPVGTALTEADLADYVAGLVVTNDVSARDVQLPKTQFYEGKSYPTFTPVGPAWSCWTPTNSALPRSAAAAARQRRAASGLDRRRRHDLPRRCGPSRADPLPAPRRRRPAADRHPGGTALNAPPKPVEIIGVAAAARTEVEGVLQGQAKNPNYLTHGDVVGRHVAHRRRADRPRHAARGGQIRMTD